MKVLGLDLSLTAPGLALIDPPNPPLGRLIKVGKLTGAERLALIGHEIRDAVWKHEPVGVGIEGYSYGSESHAHAIGELGGVVRYLLHREGYCVVAPTDLRSRAELWYVVLPPKQWRKQLFGRDVPKDQVSKEALKRYDIEFDSLDVLEGWCVATAAARLWEGLDAPPPIVRKRALRPGSARVGSVTT